MHLKQNKNKILHRNEKLLQFIKISRIKLLCWEVKQQQESNVFFMLLTRLQNSPNLNYNKKTLMNCLM